MELHFSSPDNPKIIIDKYGLMELEGIIFKSGKLNYNGKELDFSEQEISKAVDSMKGKSLVRHIHDSITPDKYKDLTVGSVKDAYMKDGDMYARVLVMDKEAQEELLATKNTSVSVGMVGDVLDSGGVENINFNHLAILLENNPRVEGAQLFMSEDQTKELKTIKRGKKMGKILKGIKLRFDDTETEVLTEEIQEVMEIVEEVEAIAETVEEPSVQAKIETLFGSLQELVSSLFKKDEEISEKMVGEEELAMSHSLGKEGVALNFSKGRSLKRSLREAEKTLWSGRAKELNFSEDTPVSEIKGAWNYRKTLEKEKGSQTKELNFSQERSLTEKPFESTRFKVQQNFN